MGYLFLKALDAPGVVSTVTIDAATAKVVEVENATIENLNIAENTITFSLDENAIPFPVGKDEKPALEWVPFHDEFNRQILKVTGLAPGSYALSIDGTPIRSFKSGDLAEGVNLALEKNTPQAMQSARVLEPMNAWHEKIQELRTVASFEFWRLGDTPHPISLATAREQVMPLIEELKDSDSGMDRQTRDFAMRYLKAKTTEPEIRTNLAETVDKIRNESRPQRHTYLLEPEPEA